MGSQITSHMQSGGLAILIGNLTLQSPLRATSAEFGASRSLSYDSLAVAFGLGDERTNRDATQIVHVILVSEPISPLRYDNEGTGQRQKNVGNIISCDN